MLALLLLTIAEAGNVFLGYFYLVLRVSIFRNLYGFFPSIFHSVSEPLVALVGINEHPCYQEPLRYKLSNSAGYRELGEQVPVLQASAGRCSLTAVCLSHAYFNAAVSDQTYPLSALTTAA